MFSCFDLVCKPDEVEGILGFSLCSNSQFIGDNDFIIFNNNKKETPTDFTKFLGNTKAAIEGWDFSPLRQFAHFVHLALGQGSDPERFNIGESLNSLILQSRNSALVFPNPLKLSEESVVRLRRRLFALNSSSSSSTSQKRVWKLTLRHADSHLNMKYLLIYL